MIRRRRSYLGLLGLVLMLLVGPPPAAAAPSTAALPDAAGAPVGWAATGTGTTGGAGAAPDSVHVVGDFAQLRAALANNGRPDDPKIVYVRGTIHGNQAPDGRLLTDQDYAPGWDIDNYMACFVDGRVWSDDAHPWCADTRRQRTTGSNAEKAQIRSESPATRRCWGSAATPACSASR
jgi:pectate lyase